MLTSASCNGFGEALTTQPRSSRGGTAAATGMDLTYVTERIIALWFPPSVTQHAFRQGQRQAAHMLRNKHGDNYMVNFNKNVILKFNKSRFFNLLYICPKFRQHKGVITFVFGCRYSTVYSTEFFK